MAALLMTAAFAGFRPDLLDFLSVLARNNTREWFAAHREQYERVLLVPARTFVVAMAELLPRLGPDIHAEPKVHGSILAINRDTRFSPDKTPYKTHLDLWFWQGDGPNRERPGYFLRLQEQSLILGAGMHAFAAEGVLERYRDAVRDPDQGARLDAAAEAIGKELIGGRTYSRVPRGLPADQLGAEWLRHSGLYAEVRLEPPPRELFSPELPEFCLAHFERLAPIQQWLVDLLQT